MLVVLPVVVTAPRVVAHSLHLVVVAATTRLARMIVASVTTRGAIAIALEARMTETVR